MKRRVYSVGPAQRAETTFQKENARLKVGTPALAWVRGHGEDGGHQPAAHQETQYLQSLLIVYENKHQRILGLKRLTNSSIASLASLEILKNIFQTDDNELMIVKVCKKTLQTRERLTGRCQGKNNRIHSQSSVSSETCDRLISCFIHR